MEHPSSADPEISALKARLKTTWEAGNYGVFAKYLEKGALEFFDRLAIPPGASLLDVACGAGQLTIPAAQRGIHVTGVDLAANLVEQAQRRAQSEGLPIQIDQGDVEALPYPDASFDFVLSLIGAMFAPRPELVAREMARVCRPGGKVIMGNWTPGGHVGEMFRVMAKHLPPPSLMPSPLLWGDEASCRERLEKVLGGVQISSSLYPMEYPFSPEKVVDFFIEYYGPINRAYAALGDEAGQRLRDDLIALWERNNSARDGTTLVMAEYIVAVGVRVDD